MLLFFISILAKTFFDEKNLLTIKSYSLFTNAARYTVLGPVSNASHIVLYHVTEMFIRTLCQLLLEGPSHAMIATQSLLIH